MLPWNQTVAAAVVTVTAVFMRLPCTGQFIKFGTSQNMKKEMATQSDILAWRIPWTEEPGGLQSTGSQRVRRDWATSLSLVKTTKYFCYGFGKWRILSFLPWSWSAVCVRVCACACVCVCWVGEGYRWLLGLVCTAEEWIIWTLGSITENETTGGFPFNQNWGCQ